MSGGGGRVLHGIVELQADALPRGALPNPTRSLILGDPAGGATCWGCVIDLDEDGELRGGLRAPARLLFWQPLHPDPPGPVPIWYGRVIGQVSDLRLVDAG
jgi:hypothetical protein